MTHPVPVITGHRRPHEVLLVFASLVIGVSYTVGAPPPASVTALLPLWAVHLWAAGMSLSGVLGIVGVAFRASWAWRIEAASMLFGAAALLWYIGAVLPFGGRGLVAAVFSAAWMGANIWRAGQILRDLRETR